MHYFSNGLESQFTFVKKSKSALTNWQFVLATNALSVSSLFFWLERVLCLERLYVCEGPIWKLDTLKAQVFICLCVFLSFFSLNLLCLILSRSVCLQELHEGNELCLEKFGVACFAYVILGGVVSQIQIDLLPE